MDFYNLKGKIISPNEIELSDGRVITSENIVITTGSAPADLPFLKRDGKYIVNSDDALEVTDVPGKLLVIGAGAIGLEMGVIYKYLGSDVTVVEIMPHIVPGSDFECADILHKELNKQKVKVLCSCSASDPVINEEEHKVSMKFKTDDKEWEDSFDKVLVAVGRKPYSEGAFSDNLGIKLDEKGFIKVDSNLMTDVKNIYACGDVTAGQLLAHRASHQATAIVEHILNSTPVHQNAVPWAVFTFPEFAGIGISEEEAKESGITYKVGKFPYSAGSRSNAIDEKAGIVKVITDENGVIIGAHIIGAEAGELLPVLIYAVIKGVKTEEFKELIFIHPTLSENIWEAVGEAGGFSIHI